LIISLIPKSEVPPIWPVVSPFIESAWAQAPGYYRAIDILDRILQDIECLWGVFDNDLNMVAAFTTQVEQYPLSRKLVITCMSGKGVRDWYDQMMEILERFAKDQGCSSIIVRGREGWRRLGRNKNWKHTASTLEYPL
jgi:hypothetical protein